MITHLPKQVAVYGAGGFGRDLTSRLIRAGISVTAILDRSAKGHYEGIPIVHPEKWQAGAKPPVVLGLHNPEVSSSVVAEQLEGLHYPTVISAVSVANWMGQQGLELGSYWLTSNSALYDRERDLIARVDSLLSDDLSSDLFGSLIRYRESGDLHDLPRPLPLSEQYLPPDLLPRIGLSRLIDCGAYDGDTLRALSRHGARPEWVLAMEPEPGNFVKLCTEAARNPELNVLCIPVGAWDSTTQLRFSGGSTAAAAVTSTGPTTVQVVSMDEMLAGTWEPTYIKMDIEGAELSALAGALSTIRQSRPAMAISAYHQPSDLWRIPLWVEAQVPGVYDHHLRQYGENCFDSVLYCLPRSGL